MGSSSTPAVFGTLEPKRIYPVTEDELAILEKGSDKGYYLAFGLASLMYGLNSLRKYFTSDLSTFTVDGLAFVYASIGIGVAVGMVLIYVWYQKRNAVDEIHQRIRARIREFKGVESENP